MTAIFRKLLYFEDDGIQKKIESSFGEISDMSVKTWKELVEILCSMVHEMKRKFEDQQNILIKENKKMKEDLTTQKKQILTENSEVIGGVSQNMREIYDKELKKYEEKVGFINLWELKLLLIFEVCSEQSLFAKNSE